MIYRTLDSRDAKDLRGGALRSEDSASRLNGEFSWSVSCVLAGVLILCCVIHPPARGDSVEPEPPITAADRAHWAFRPLSRPALPEVRDAYWPRNGIDRFILAKIERAGLQPLPEADRVTLIRRATFDLFGLPPTPREIDQFIHDDAPDAYERLVDRLLASPAYGERWGQHWLDLARFAETDGFEHDLVRPDAWRYRDWVIQALNADMPYDEFVRLQLAGDVLRPDDAAADAARFLLCGPDMPDINLQDERRHNFMNDLAATVGSVFLGLQFGCAQCHDHKFDPISQHDFYRLRAFFDPAIHVAARKPAKLDEKPGTTVESYFMVRGDFRRRGPRVEPAFPRIANLSDAAPTTSEENERGARVALAEWITRSDHPLTTRVIVNRLWQHHFGQGLSKSASDFGLMGDPPSHPELLDWLATEFSGHARNVDFNPREDNWSLKRLHRLMVTSATYRQASRPLHADRSAEENAETARVWQRARKVDPDNDLLARMPRRRLEGEAIRDTMLAAAGTLNRRTGGPGVRPPLPKELVATLLNNQWQVTEDEADHNRRSIYLFVRRNLRYPIFEVFDKPDTNASCPRRNQSTIAPQALVLLNSELSLSTAREMAALVLHATGADRDQQIELCYRRALGRLPTTNERQLAREFLSTNAARLRSEARPAKQLAVPASLSGSAEKIDIYDAAALTDFCLALFNLNEFVYID